MAKKILAWLVVPVVLVCACTGCGGAKVSISEVVVGIAWRGDLLSPFYTNVCAVITRAGARAVLLGKVRANGLIYDDGNLAAACINPVGYLKMEYANKVKTQGHRASNAREVMAGIDAVVFTGGEDISPTLYKEVMPWHGIEQEKDFNPDRDVSDYLLMKHCLDHDIAFLSICRGMQMLGVVAGGKMIQDIPVYYKENKAHYTYCHRNRAPRPGAYRDYAPHSVRTFANSRVRELAGCEYLHGCPSWHHQAIQAAPGMTAIVTASHVDHGLEIVEALECPDKTFAVGLQFHPEAAIIKRMNGAANADDFMSCDRALRFFTALIDAARTK